MRWIQLFENFSTKPLYVDFYEESYEEKNFKPITPNEKDNELYNQFYKAVSKGSWCNKWYFETENCFQLQQDLDKDEDEYFYAKNGDENWYVDIYKYSETQSPDTDPSEAWYIITIDPSKDRTQNALKVKCDGSDGMMELIKHAQSYPGKIGKYFRLLDTYVKR